MKGAITRSLSEILPSDQFASILKHISEEDLFDRPIAGVTAERGDEADTKSRLSIVGCISYEIQSGKVGLTTFVGPVLHTSSTKDAIDANLIELVGDTPFSSGDIWFKGGPGDLAE